MRGQPRRSRAAAYARVRDPTRTSRDIRVLGSAGRGAALTVAGKIFPIRDVRFAADARSCIIAGVPIDADAFRDFERRAHDRVARTYVDFFEPVTAGAIPTLLDAAGVAAGSRVLDVACGPGAVATAAAERGAGVTGVDLSPQMVAVARARHPGLDFREADAERLPFPEGAFD